VKHRPVAIDLFAGVGGMSLGFEQAGFDVAAAVEIDPVHACAYRYNFPNCNVLARSIVGLDALDLKWGAGGIDRVDVVFGGAPCQGFSLIGHRALDDPRNTLVREFLRVVVELQASYFVFENVKGLTVGQHVRFLNELVEEFRDYGYQVLEPWRVLNAVEYGVPQSRERLFLIGCRQGLVLPDYPRPKSRHPNSQCQLFGLPSAPTCAEALSDVPDAEDYEELDSDDEVLIGDWCPETAYAREMRCCTTDAWHYGQVRIWERAILTASMRTNHTHISRRRFLETPPGTVEPISRFYKLSPNGVSNTLRAGTDSARGAFTSPRPIHYSAPRCVTVREMARLHGFPDWFRFHKTKWHGARQIGNAVPPPLARSVAEVVMDALGGVPSHVARPTQLGDPRVLAMGMAEASHYWGVERQIGRRDRKSGAKKRKQLEIERERVALSEGYLGA